MEIKVNFKGGGSSSEIAPKFSLNAENIYVAWKNKIYGYNVLTGKRISVFSGIKVNIVDFYIHSLDTFECITACSVDGELVTWKTATYFKVGNSNVGVNSVDTFTMFCPKNLYKIKALISYKINDLINFMVYDFDSGKSQNYLFALQSAFPCYIDVLPSKGYFVVAQRHKIYFLHVNSTNKIVNIRMHKSRHFTCISCHPTDDRILTGDNTGRIVLWQNFFKLTKPIQTIYHWHTLSVNCINFTSDGTQFFSGGNESVLVKWYIDNTLEKNFLPRLTSEIRHIKLSSYNRYISLSLNDNSIYIIDTQFKKISIIQYLVIGDMLKNNMIYDERSKSLLLNGNPGCLQFYLPNDGSLLYNVDIVDANRISNERNCEIENTQITNFTINKTGLWLATIEENQYYKYSPEIRLKFWQFNLNKQQFSLNTSIEYPHNTTINSIKFQPIIINQLLKCITVGDDKLFKIWQLTDLTNNNNNNNNNDKKYGWIFYSCGYYRNLSCNTLSFSIDGTLFGVNFDNLLTIWSPETNELKTTLSNVYCKEIIKNLHFGRNNYCHLIVVTTKNSITVWNILTLTIVWIVDNIKIEHFICDNITTNMAIITKDRQVLVFVPNSPIPIYKSEKLLKKHKKILNCCFIPTKYSNDVRLKWYQRSTICFINSKKELYCIGEDEDESSSLSYNDGDDNDENQSLFDKINPKFKSNNLAIQQQQQQNIVVLPEQKNIKKYLEAPIHSSVPVRILCKSLLKSMVLQK